MNKGWYEIILDGMRWDGMGWYEIILDGMRWYGMVWDGIEWLGDGMG